MHSYKYSHEEKSNSTSVIPYGTRGMEINEWLMTHPKQHNIPYEYAIIDDGDDFLSIQSEHIIITEPETGLTKELAKKAITILL